MRRKVGNLIVYILFAAVIFASFRLPDILLKSYDISFGASMYDLSGRKSIDIEADEIYLVKAIHDMESVDEEQYHNYIFFAGSLSEYKVSSGQEPVQGEDVQGEDEQAEDEIAKLKECGVLQETDTLTGAEAEILKEIYKTDQSEYIIDNLFFLPESSVWLLEREEKTGKILTVCFSGRNMPEEAERRELLENYIRYLDLYIIDDWVYEDQQMKSDKADLAVGFKQAGEGYILSIVHARDAFYNETQPQYMESIEYKYDLYRDLTSVYESWGTP